MRRPDRIRQDGRVEELLSDLAEEIAENEIGTVLTRGQLQEVADVLDRYTVAMPTASDTERLLQRLASAGTRQGGMMYEEAAEDRAGEWEWTEHTEEDTEGHLFRFLSVMRAVRSQTRLFAWPFWLVSAFLILLGSWLGFYSEGDAGINPLVLTVPLLAALSVCAAFRTFGTPMFELEMTMPVTPAQLVYGRLLLILGGDVVLALAVSPMAASGKQDLGGLIADWLLPLMASSLAALAAVLYVRPFAAAGISLAVWTLVLLLDHDRVSSRFLPLSVAPISEGMVRLSAAAILTVSALLVHLRLVKLRGYGGRWS